MNITIRWWTVAVILFIVGIFIGVAIHKNFALHDIKVVECECGGENDIQCGSGFVCEVTDGSYNSCGECVKYGSTSSGGQS